MTPTTPRLAMALRGKPPLTEEETLEVIREVMRWRMHQECGPVCRWPAVCRENHKPVED